MCEQWVRDQLFTEVTALPGVTGRSASSLTMAANVARSSADSLQVKPQCSGTHCQNVNQGLSEEMDDISKYQHWQLHATETGYQS